LRAFSAPFGKVALPVQAEPCTFYRETVTRCRSGDRGKPSDSGLIDALLT